MTDYSEYNFKIGKSFRITENSNPDAYLETALEAEKWIRTHQYENEDGIYWKLDASGNVDLSFADGIPGLTYFYLELAGATGNNGFEEIAKKASLYLSKNWRNILKDNGFQLGENFRLNIYSGVVGIGMVLINVYRKYHRNIEKNAILEIVELLKNEAVIENESLCWCHDPIILFDGGIALFLCNVAEILGLDDIQEILRKAADTILKAGVTDERGGLKWENSLASYALDKRPNFELGTAGVGYVLTKLYEILKDDRYLEGAKQAAEHLRAISIRKGKGYLIPYKDEPSEGLIFYVSSCHGPAGTSKLFYQLYKHTGKAEYLYDIQQLYDGLRALGVPEKQSAGYWNNLCLCCGTAGILQFFLNYYNVIGDKKLLEAAVKAGNILLGEQQKQEVGTAWPLAWTRVTPENIAVTYAYNNGASGIASALVQLYLTLKGDYHWDKLIDDPYPEISKN